MSKKHRANPEQHKSSMERRAQKVHPTGGEGSKEHKTRAKLMMYAAAIAAAWTVVCITLAASGKWRWDEGVLFTSHIAILAVFGPLTLYALWANNKYGGYGQAIWMLIIYSIVVTFIIIFTI